MPVSQLSKEVVYRWSTSTLIVPYTRHSIDSIQIEPKGDFSRHLITLTILISVLPCDSGELSPLLSHGSSPTWIVHRAGSSGLRIGWRTAESPCAFCRLRQPYSWLSQGYSALCTTAEMSGTAVRLGSSLLSAIIGRCRWEEQYVVLKWREVHHQRSHLSQFMISPNLCNIFSSMGLTRRLVYRD